MKTTLILVGLALTASAQTPTPFVFQQRLVTNPPVTVPASGVVMAHTVSEVIAYADVAFFSGNGLVPYEQSAGRIVARITNLVDQVQRPLLSVQKNLAEKQRTKDADQRPPPSKITPEATATVDKNSSAYKKAQKLGLAK